jgi:nucleoside-diphosphate-sugar epimerase
MKVLVTGAAGFLGREVVAQLRRAGYAVATTDRTGGVDARGDLADPAFTRTLPECDAVVHAAAVQYVSRDLPFLARRDYFAHNNLAATASLCGRYSGSGAHFVNVGTSMMYAQCRAPIYRTTSRMQGQGVYSRSKLAAQQYVAAMPDPHATVVPCIIGGPGREGLFRGFVSLMMRHGLVVVPGRGEHPTHMVHVADAASLLVRVVATRAEGFFNAAGPEPLSIMQWVDEIEAALGLAPVRRLRLPLAPIALASAATGYRLLAREQVLMLGQPHVLATDESLALGWQPQHSNARIVRDIARYIAGRPEPV